MSYREQTGGLTAHLKQFTSGDFQRASIEFFKALGYQSDRTININSVEDFKKLVDRNDLLNEENACISRWQSVHFLFQITEKEIHSGSGGTLSLGFAQPYERKDIRSYLFFAIKLGPRTDGSKVATRTELSKITRSINRLVPQPVLVLFLYDHSLSLAIINRRKNMRDATRDVLTRVSLIRDIDCIHPHRAHVDILERFSLHRLRAESESLRTFAHFDDAWKNLLSVRELRRTFYRELVAWFHWAKTEIKLARLPNMTPDTVSNRSRATKEFTVRLISRTLFAWFLKEMRLIPAELLELYGITDERRFLPKAPYNPDANSYYRGILQNVFFQALNRPMDQRRKSGPAAANDRTVTKPELKRLDYLGKNHLPEDFDYDLFDRIPYLNGGLFDTLSEDNASDTIEDGAFKIPNKLFYAKQEDGFMVNVGAGKRASNQPVEGLNRIFDRYRFTVSENTPLEEDVALDPELLGLVFENLLAEIDPDDTAAAKTARKASGSYYTPRQIVDYMVNEALHLHLRTQLEKSGATREDMQALTRLCYIASGEEDFSAIADRVVTVLERTRVLDPACGSGAFPMGMLHRMVDLLSRVDPDNERWKQRLLNRLPPGMREDAHSGMEGKSYNYLRKLGLIQENLFGLDIQPLAALIAKLRFFLTLIIEQEVNLNDRNHNYGLQSLPNLETNILCANTLKDEDHGLLEGPILSELRTIRKEYFQPQITRERRDELARKVGEKLATIFPGFAKKTKGIRPNGDTSLDREQIRWQQDAAWLAEWFKHASVASPFFNVETFFPELIEEGEPNPAPFHIIIGNPPYGGTTISNKIKSELCLGSKDPYGAFIARFMGANNRASPLAEGGVLAYIVSDTFMTIRTHRPLREQMLQHRIHKMIRVAGDTFKATVNCAVILCQRGAASDSHTCLMADLTNLSIHNHDQYERFLHILYQTEGAGAIIRRQNISNQTYAIFYYRQSLIQTNSNNPFFAAYPKLFALMNDTTAPVLFETIGSIRVPVRKVSFNGNDVRLIKLGDIAEVKQGLATGDNKAYLFQNPKARGSYRSIEEYRKFLLIEADLERIRSDETLRLDVIQHGISTNDSQSPRYFDGRYIVPYDKGGASESVEGWMPNYWVPTDYFIDWSEWAVHRMKTLTTRERNREKGRPGGRDSLASRFQNADSYFTDGITFSSRGIYAPTFRRNSGACYDKESSGIFAYKDTEEILGILASKVGKHHLKGFLQQTVSMDVDALKELHIPTDVTGIAAQVGSIIAHQRTNPRYDYASNEQLEIDWLVYRAYGLNEADIREVENWYARRYPKLAQAQRSALAGKRGLDESRLMARAVVNLYCDESRHLPHDHEPFMLLGLVSCPAKNVRDYHLELRKLARDHGLTDNYEIKWTHIRPGKLAFYEALVDWFFDKRDLVFRCLLLPDKQIVFERLPEDNQDLAYYRLYAHLLRSAFEPEKSYRTFIDKKDTRGGDKIREVRDWLQRDQDDSDGKAVQDIQQIQSHEARLMQLTDLFLGAVGAAHSENSLPKSKKAVVTKLADHVESPITWDTESLSDRFKIATYHDIDSLVS